MLSFNVQAFCAKLEGLRVPFAAVTAFGSELGEILREGLEFGQGVELSLRFAYDRGQFIAAWSVPIPTLGEDLPKIEDLFRCMTPIDRKDARAELAKFATARPIASTRPAKIA
jgi:hypothetical protein